MASRRAPSHKQATTSFIETHQTAYAFLRKTYEEPQITLLLEARNVATNTRSIIRSFHDLLPAVDERLGDCVTLPPLAGFALCIPPSVQADQYVQMTFTIATRLANSLTDFAQVPAFRPIFIEWCREWWGSLQFLRRINLNVRRLEAEIIAMIANAGRLPLPNERHLTALSILDPTPLEQPEPRIPHVKARVDRWRYAIQIGSKSFVYELGISRVLEPPRWPGPRPLRKSSPISSLV